MSDITMPVILETGHSDHGLVRQRGYARFLAADLRDAYAALGELQRRSETFVPPRGEERCDRDCDHLSSPCVETTSDDLILRVVRVMPDEVV